MEIYKIVCWKKASNFNEYKMAQSSAFTLDSCFFFQLLAPFTVVDLCRGHSERLFMNILVQQMTCCFTCNTILFTVLNVA